MAGLNYTTPSVPINDKVLSGGLNSTSGPLNLQNHESSDLQNIDFTKFGSIVKRNGYTALNTTAVNSSADINGLFNFTVTEAASVSSLVAIAGDKMFRMDALDGTWDNMTSAITITDGYKVDFAAFQNTLFMTNGVDNPFHWDATRNASCSASSCVDAITLQKAECVELYNNYLFYGNVTISGTAHPSRIYWSDFKDAESWTATSFIDINQNDGDEITRLQVLSDRLVIFKTRSIYNLFFTGDSDVPFVLPNGGKSNSTVGCIAPFSVQEVDNGLVFMAYDGFYFYDGLNSYKISDRINTTFLALNRTTLNKAVSCVQRDKNRYLCAVTSSGQTENDKVLVWDYYNNAWSIYDGLDPCYMTTLWTSNSERPYWGDYAGFVYRGDTGADDYPLNSQTAIDSYYWTNWKSYEDLINKKGISHMALFYQISATTVTVSYSYDLETAPQKSQIISFDTSADNWGEFNWGEGEWAAEGGAIKRLDLPSGRGRVVRYKFANNIKAETMQIDGFGVSAHLETVA